MSLTLGRQGGIAQPLKKRTVGQTNIAHVYDGANHIWPTSVIHFSDFTSVQLRYIWGSDDGRDLLTYLVLLLVVEAVLLLLFKHGKNLVKIL